MHSFARHRHREASKASAKETKGLVLNGGWRYDLTGWFHDTFSFRGKFREFRQRTINLACIVRAASQALTRGQSRSPVPARKRLGATCPSSSRSG